MRGLNERHGTIENLRQQWFQFQSTADQGHYALKNVNATSDI
jgi:hypothetical protein